ncbi:MAG: hypothetical protein IJW46_00320 [Clostridia bacterium]|nr:hypothetical protein [Clostridia bacterium]
MSTDKSADRNKKHPCSLTVTKALMRGSTLIYLSTADNGASRAVLITQPIHGCTSQRHSQVLSACAFGTDTRLCQNA